MRNKKRSANQLGIEIDEKVIEKWQKEYPNTCQLIQGDALSVISEMEINQETVIYSDPPYLPETRSREKVYKHDYTIEDHRRLLRLLAGLPCRVLISGYASDLYDEYLTGWNTYEYMSKTHTGMREETIWYNYPKPTQLHDSRYLGSDFREREKIKRRQENLKQKIQGLPSQEQAAIFDWLQQHIEGEVA